MSKTYIPFFVFRVINVITKIFFKFSNLQKSQRLSDLEKRFDGASQGVTEIKEIVKEHCNPTNKVGCAYYGFCQFTNCSWRNIFKKTEQPVMNAKDVRQSKLQQLIGEN